MATDGSDSSTLDLELDDGSPRYLTATIGCVAPDFTSQLNLSNGGALPLGFKVRMRVAIQPPSHAPHAPN